MKSHRVSALLLGVLLTLSTSSCNFSYKNSDESVFRKEFKIPSTAKLTQYQSQPEEPIRESLNIEAEFSFETIEAFMAYQQSVQQQPKSWRSLPIPNTLLSKIIGQNRKILRDLKQTQPEKNIKSISAEDLSKNPAIQQRLENWAQKHNIPQEGYFRCLTAGNDIMGATKVRCTDDGGAQSDAMVGILDPITQTLKIIVWTGY